MGEQTECHCGGTCPSCSRSNDVSVKNRKNKKITVGDWTIFIDYDPQEKRAPKGTKEGGEWISSGKTETSSKTETSAKPKLNKEVIDVGGDDWNKKTAERLEKEYESVKGELDNIIYGKTDIKWDDLTWSDKNDAFSLFSIKELETGKEKISEWNNLTNEEKLKYFRPNLNDYKILDPLQEKNENEIYLKTKKISKFIFLSRAIKIYNDRKLGNLRDSESVIRADSIKDADNQLWNSWKDSSTSKLGIIMQIAAAKELGGRIFLEHIPNRDSEQAYIDYANEYFKNIGGFEGVKALMRAKWETTQYILDKSNNQTLNLYRGLSLKNVKDNDVVIINKSGDDYSLVPNVNVNRNGLLSTSTQIFTANNWVVENGFVLRIKVPRTAVLSVPAYGKNNDSEKEVVVVGTAWKGYDLWKNKAPSYDDVECCEHKKESNEIKNRLEQNKEENEKEENKKENEKEEDKSKQSFFNFLANKWVEDGGKFSDIAEKYKSALSDLDIYEALNKISDLADSYPILPEMWKKFLTSWLNNNADENFSPIELKHLKDILEFAHYSFKDIPEEIKNQLKK